MDAGAVIPAADSRKKRILAAAKGMHTHLLGNSSFITLLCEMEVMGEFLNPLRILLLQLEGRECSYPTLVSVRGLAKEMDEYGAAEPTAVDPSRTQATA